MPGDSEHSDSPQRRSHQTNGDPSGGSALYWGGQPVAYDPQYYDRAHAASPYNHNMALHPASYGQNFSFTAAALGATSSNASSSLGMSVSPPHWVPGNAPWATSGSYVGSMGALGTSFGREREREIEAKYVRDFTCCGRQLNGLHELLEHYEEDHPNLPPDARMAALNAAQAVGPNRNSFETPAPAYAPNVINPPYQSSHGEVPTPPGMMDIEMDETAVQGPSSGNQFALRQAYAQPQYPAKGQKYSSAPSSPWSTAFRPPPNMMAPSQCLPPSLLSFNGPSQNYPATSQQHGQAQPQPQPQSQPQHLPHLQQQQQQQQQDPSFRPIKKQQKRIATPYEDASDAESERRFVCPFEGCGKVYKQANGLKYHLTRSINSTHGTLPPGTTLPVYPMEKLHGDQ